MDRIVLTVPEATWFARNVLKSITTMEAAAKQDPTILERKTYRTLVRVKEQADIIASIDPGLLAEKQEILLPKKERSVIRSMIDGVVKVLGEKIIPTYKNRGEGYEQYLKDAEMKLELLKKMSRKFK